MTIEALLEGLHDSSVIEFEQVMRCIDEYYEFTPVAFTNGSAKNSAGENNGSCKVFAFAKIHGLNEQQTLALFGRYYREDVCNAPDGDDHQNIRNFQLTGWPGIDFDSAPLKQK